MTRAAIYWNPEAYDTSGKALMGRHAAGEGFVRGYIRHGSAERLTLWNVVNGRPEALEPLVRRIEPTSKPIDWIGRSDVHALGRVGVLNLPGPGLHRFAWARRQLDPRAYSFCGVTHTTVLGGVMDTLNQLAIAPVEPWDGLVCTSRAVMASLQVQADMLDGYLKARLGARRAPRPQYAYIPLGVNASDFEPQPKDRQHWREALSIADDDIAVLYVGRFNITSKMNPVPMAIALEQAAVRTKKPVHWVLSGWAQGPSDAAFRDAIVTRCPNVTVHFVDGRAAQTRFSIWAVADIFLSLSDNVQETFGLTPVEAMAAGLPSVISDWDGYKDLVRHGIDGFRVSTYTPSAGLGRDLAHFHAQEWSSYDAFVGAVSQFTAIDIGETVRALSDLIVNKDLRTRMGEAAGARAKALFDWKAIIPRYEALWAELNSRRRAGAQDPVTTRNAGDNPWRPDPFRLFASYPTAWLTRGSVLGPAPGADWAELQPMLASEAVRPSGGLLPQLAEVEQIMAFLATRGRCTAADVLANVPEGRRPQLERGLVWMAKYGLLTIQAPPGGVMDLGGIMGPGGVTDPGLKG